MQREVTLVANLHVCSFYHQDYTFKQLWMNFLNVLERNSPLHVANILQQVFSDKNT